MILIIAFLFFVTLITVETSEVMLVVCSRISVRVLVSSIGENTYMNLKVMETANKHNCNTTTKIPYVSAGELCTS
jgi:hypothetical protein